MADEKIYTNIGHVTAYAYAKSKGYTGSEDQFATDQANFAANAQQVRGDKESVEATVETFGNTTVPAAVQTVTAEGTRQVGIVGTAGDTQVARVQGEGTTQVGVVQTEGTTQKNAVQAKGNEVIASIPSDYTELTEEVNDLKSAVNQKVSKPTVNPNGTNGQLLRTNGDGTTTWVDEGLPTDEQTEQAVSSWLAAHPEATTTVQDGSLTKVKFADEVSSKYVLIPDAYTGTDSQKIQACLNALSTTGGTIVINRTYTLTDNLTCSLDTSTNKRIAFVGLGKEAKIACSSYGFVGTTDDRTGGLWFYNIEFTGTATLFDCSKLIRMRFMQCYFSGFDKVFESGSDNASQILQSIYVDQCYFRNILTAVFYNPTNAVFDIHVTNCTMEAGGTFFISNGSDYIACLVVENCCFEGIAKILKTSATQNIFQCVFNGNHFEQNTEYFDISNCGYIANMSICNNFFGENNKKALIKLPSAVNMVNTTGALTVTGNTLADRTAQAYLFGLPSTPVKGNYKAIKHENNRLDYLTDSNSYNAYLPYKTFRKLELTYTGANFDAFVTAMATDLMANQPVSSENYEVLWSGNNWYSVTFTKISDTAAYIYIFNGTTAYIIQFVSGSITRKNEIPFVSALSNYMPVGTASDADQAKTTGVYAIGTALYLVMRLDSGFISQLRFKYNTDYIEYRSCIGGTWQNWYRLTGTAVT